MDGTIKLAEPIDGATYRKVLGHYPTGVCVVTAVEPDGKCAALVVGSFTSVSLDPPLVAFFPDRSSTSWPRIERAGKFCVNVLSSHQQDLCRRFSAKGDDKFAGLDYSLSANGSPVLQDVVAWIDCTLDAVHEAGDHFIVLGHVRELDIVRAEQPLVFFKGKYGDFSPLIEGAPDVAPVAANASAKV
jgi:3-hydroxy-9,10-secoandrosta-1,3,5(10)-triene-9,17-dione monooxygenase reductase component